MRRRLKWSVRAAAATALPALLALSCIEPSGPGARLVEPRILFVSNRDGNDEIYSMYSDGSNVVRLTENNARDTHPVWSPDGTSIVFVSERSGNRDIWIMNDDGTGVRNLTADPSVDDNPNWSPDASRIVFSSNRLGNVELFVTNADGSEISPGVRVTRLTDHFATDTWPAFSPDGRFIAFHADRNSIFDDIYVLFNTTNDLTRVTTAGGADQSPSWSPDGTRIAFSSMRDGNFEVYLMDFNFFPVVGANQRNLTNDPGSDGRPSWSFNGRQICWMSNRGGSNDIWVMNADGSNPVRLTTEPSIEDFCSIK
jgi:TolB protein